jgi:hypothetical protein
MKMIMKLKDVDAFIRVIASIPIMKAQFLKKKNYDSPRTTFSVLWYILACDGKNQIPTERDTQKLGHMKK